MNIYSSKQIVFLNLSLGPVEKNLDSSDENLQPKIETLSLKSGRWLPKCFKKDFISANYALDKLSSVLTTILKTLAEFWKRFGQKTAENSVIFQIFLFCKGSSGNEEFTIDKPNENFLPRVGFYRWKSQINFKKRLFLKKFCSKKILWTRRSKCSLDNPAECCSPELWKLFGRIG